MEIFVIILLILLNGFFSMSEIAVVSFKKNRIESLKHRLPKGVTVAIELQQNQSSFLAAIQIGITIISLVNGFIGGNVFAKYFTPLFLRLNLNNTAAYSLAVTISIVIVTFITIIMGELVPKSIGLSQPEIIAAKTSPVIQFISRLFAPLVKLLSATTRLIDKLLGIKSEEKKITEDELRDILKEAAETDIIEEEQSELHEKIFYFADKKALHIMTHRSEIKWIDINMPEEQFIEKLANMKISKILVCDDNLENYIGILNVKEFFIKVYKKIPLQLKDMLYEPLVFTETTEAQFILNEFKAKQIYFGIVVNEFGEIQGIVTLHDVIENIVGDMPEEEEIVEPDYFVRDDNSVLVNGDAPVEVLLDLIAGFEIDFEEVDYSTVAGFVLEHLDKGSREGDYFIFMDYKIEIVDMDHNRIDKVLVAKYKPS